MVVSKKWLKENMTEGVGIKRTQCEALGISYPPPKGWARRLLGKNITSKQAALFVMNKNKDAKISLSEIEEKSIESTVSVNGETRIIITKKWLKNAVLPGYEMNAEQAKVLKIKPDSKKIMQKALGKKITIQQAQKFINLKNAEPKGKKVLNLDENRATENFISRYLIPTSRIFTIKNAKNLITDIANLSASYDEERIIKYIRGMPYNKFLQTPYWKIISLIQKKNDGRKCVLCGSKDILNVHHITYKNHGNEILHPENLITVCRQCHMTIHGIKE